MNKKQPKPTWTRKTSYGTLLNKIIDTSVYEYKMIQQSEEQISYDAINGLRQQVYQQREGITLRTDGKRKTNMCYN